VPRIGTLPLAVPAACGSSFCVQPGALRLTDLHIGTTGSRVPTSSLDRARATYMPDAAWTVSRFLPDPSQGCQTGPGSDVIIDSRHLAGGLSTSPSRSLPDASHNAFSAYVHHDRLFTDAARGGLEPSPAGGLRGACPICWPASNSASPIYFRGASFIRGTPWLSSWLSTNSRSVTHPRESRSLHPAHSPLW
jgi:hypothetical protein